MEYWSDVAIQILTLMGLGISLNLLLGYAGQMSMAHAAFYGIGAYGAALLSMATTVSGGSGAREVETGLGINVWVALIIAAIITFVFAFVVSVPAAWRVRGDLLILFTLAFQLVITQVMNAAGNITGGGYGLGPIRPMTIGGYLAGTAVQALPIFVVLVIVIGLIVRRMGESPYGRLLKGIREDQLAVSSLGRDPKIKIIVTFGVTASLAAVVGACGGYYYQFIAPGTYSVDTSILIVAAIVLGGLANIWGTIIGAIVLGLLRPLLEQIIGGSGSGGNAILWQGLIYGAALVVMMIFRPQGILPEGASLQRLFGRPATRKVNGAVAAVGDSGQSVVVEPMVAEADSHGSEASGVDIVAGSKVLEVSGLSKRFGGLRAVDDVTFGLEKGKITGLIGPNGAGKTTIYNLITGALLPDSGRVILRGEDVTGEKPHALVKKGVARSWQDVRLFTRMTVLNNVAMGVPGQAGEKLWTLFFGFRRSRRSEKATVDKAMECLRTVGCEHVAGQVVGDLSYGDQKLVAIARLMATGCEVLLLDEPTSGVDPDSVEKVIEVVRRLRTAGRTILLIEHSVHLIEQLSDIVVFLDQGRVLAMGAMDELKTQQGLTDLYFGT